METISGTSLVTFEAFTSGEAVILEFDADKKVILDETTVSEMSAYPEEDIKIGRAIDTDKPVIPQDFRLHG